MSLTVKQNTFAWDVGFRRMSYADAYKSNFDTENMQEYVICNRGFAEANKPAVRERIESYVLCYENQNVILRSDILSQLSGLCSAKNKDGSPDYRTQLKALELSSKILGVEQPKEVHMKIEPLNINMSFDKE